jgi:hypothetical protein
MKLSSSGHAYFLRETESSEIKEIGKKKSDLNPEVIEKNTDEQINLGNNLNSVKKLNNNANNSIRSIDFEEKSPPNSPETRENKLNMLDINDECNYIYFI